MGMLILVLGLNLVISFLNARNVGRVWAETKAIGGWIRVVAWASSSPTSLFRRATCRQRCSACC